MNDAMNRPTTTFSITAHTSIVGLIGWPVGHSVSPKMHNAAFQATGLDWSYLPFPVSVQPPARVGEAVHGLRALGMRGANVTVPHKQAVMPYLDELTPAAAAIGAVNTIFVREDGSLLGDNTDARGLVADLCDHDIDPRGAAILILGAGGSARAAAFGLAEAGARAVTILNRTVPRATELMTAMAEHFPGCDWRAGALEDIRLHAGAELIVNCTSLGMEPDVKSMPWKTEHRLNSDQAVYDLVYNPTPTRFVEFASDCGARAVNGKGMLVWQGALAFELWTGVPAPVDAMRRAIGAM